MDKKRNLSKTLLMVAFTIAVQLVIFDVLSAYGLFYYFELKGYRSPELYYSVDGRFPLVWTVRKLYSTVYHKVWPYSRGWPALSTETDPFCPPQATPAKPFQADPNYGRSIRPGSYTIDFCPTAMTPPQKYRWTMTIEADGGRRTAYEQPKRARRILMLGDSFILGWGLNDEQTASWLLQTYFANEYTVQNISGAGWGTTEELITVRRLASSLGPDDVVILGYGDYYKRRNVAAPSRARLEAAVANAYQGVGLSLARARMSNSSVVIDYVPIGCKPIDEYCDQADPPASVIDATTIALYREIADRLRSRLAVLHLGGADDDPVLSFFRDHGIRVIEGRPDRTKYFMNDHIAGYDTHPGAMANYSWFAAVRSFIER